MSRVAAGCSIALLCGIGFWAMVNITLGTREPWDSDQYLVWPYPVAILISGVLGFAFQRRAWVYGLIVMFAQIPIMIACQSFFGPFMVFGALFVVIESVPAMLLAELAARVRRRFV